MIDKGGVFESRLTFGNPLIIRINYNHIHKSYSLSMKYALSAKYPSSIKLDYISGFVLI